MNKIILLNGASSSGKTSIAKHLQEIFENPYFHINVDLILEMAPPKLKAIDPAPGDIALEGFYWTTQENGDERILESKTGILGQRLVRSVYLFIRELIKADINLIIDDVFFSDERLKTYVELIPHDNVYLIGVHCSLEQLIKREGNRKNRRIGEAKGQFNTVHNKIPYDFTVDTTNLSSPICAEQIKKFISENTSPIAFKQFRVLHDLA